MLGIGRQHIFQHPIEYIMISEAAASRYFTLTDDKSNKFWQISLDGAGYTVIYGRIGTSGQSQQKRFDNEEKCSAEADKIIREKMAKGYVEQVNGIAVDVPQDVKQKVSRTKTNDDTAQSQEEVLVGYQRLIDRGKPKELLPFLQTVDRKHYPALRKSIKAARKHYCDFVHLLPAEREKDAQSEWGVRGNDGQRTLIELSGLALLPASEYKSFNLLLLLGDRKIDPVLNDLLGWAKPEWLTNYLNEDSRSNSWAMIEYRQLRAWEAKGFVHFLPELFARSVAQCRSSFNDYAANARQCIEYLCQDEMVCQREIPLLFAFETDLHNARFGVQPKPKGPIEQVVIWAEVFRRLLTNGKLDRKWFLDSCIMVQSKDWNSSLRSFFRKQMEDMTPTENELVAIQPTLFQLLGAQHPHVVNWAAGFIKDISAHAGFDLQALLEWSPAVLMRSDCKSAIKALLSVLEKSLKSRSEKGSEIVTALTDVFAISDLSLQTKVAGLIRKYGDPEDDALREKIAVYDSQLLGTLREELSTFAGEIAAKAESQGSEKKAYSYTMARPPLLSELVPVQPPQTWNDWLFAIGKYIGSDDPLDMELLINGCILMYAGPNRDDSGQLQPYITKLANSSEESRIRAFTHSWLLHIIQNPKTPFTYPDDWQGSFQTPKLHIRRLQHLQAKISAGSQLTLLSMPTHAPHYVAPRVLVERLLAYQNAKEAIDPLDLTIAIARTLSDGAEEALPLCDKLDEPLASLVRYALTGNGELTPKKAGLLRSIAKGLGLEKDSADIEIAYMVAARTRKPDASFSVFNGSQFANRLNVIMPFAPAWHIKERKNEYQDYWTKELRHYPSVYELWLDLPAKVPTPSALLYSNDLVVPAKSAYWWLIGFSAYDALWWYSIVPQAPEGLFTVLLQYGCRSSELSAAAVQGLHVMLQPGFQFRPMSMMVLVCGLLAAKRETRGLAAEVLMQHFGTQTLEPKSLGHQLGALMRESYAPVQRLAENCLLIKDISPLHNKALLMMLEEVLLAFSILTELPKNTKKLLETYLDLLVKLGEKPSIDISDFLQQRAASGTLKPIIKSLKELA